MTMAMTSERVVVVVAGCLLWCVCLVGRSSAAVTDECAASFRSPTHVDLCHDEDLAMNREPDTYTCSSRQQGFVVKQLVIAPQPAFTDCGLFTVQNLLSAQCLRQVNHLKDVYDRLIFDLLSKVSGQNQIGPAAVTERFPLDGEQTSAFIVFQKICRPANPEHNDDHATMINICSNQSVSDTRVYLTLRGTADVPDAPSMCRCTLRPTRDVRLVALDVRLQNSSNRRCGDGAVKIESQNSQETKDLECQNMTAWYGFEELYALQVQNQSVPHEIVLTLSSVSASNFPAAVWIEAVEEFDVHDSMSVTCEGFIPMPAEVPDGDDGGDGGDSTEDRTGVDEDEDSPETADAGMDFIKILAPVLGGIGLIVIIVIVLVVVRKRRGSYGGGLLSCDRCSSSDKDDDIPTFYRAVPQEPVYAEPGNPRPSTSTPPYTFPADARLPDGRAVYAEPDPNGTLSQATRATTPPPLPDSPPPGSPPPGSPPFFPPATPPPKPERTLLRKHKESEKVGSEKKEEEEEEEYDHINLGGRCQLKPTPGRDGQNNIIGGRRASEEASVYSGLDHGQDYSPMLTFPSRGQGRGGWRGAKT